MELPIYYVYDLNLSKFDLRSLIDEVREFKVWRKVTITNMLVNRAVSSGYEVDHENSKDYSVVVIVRGKVFGKIESIIQEPAPGQNVINITHHGGVPLQLIVS